MARMKIYYKVLYYVNRTILCFKINSKDTSFYSSHNYNAYTKPFLLFLLKIEFIIGHCFIFIISLNDIFLTTFYQDLKIIIKL